MDIINRCANNFSQLLQVEYKIIIGRKGKTEELTLNFEKADFHHLAGLHKLSDLAILKQGMRERIFESILRGNITQQDIEKSAFYSEIVNRLVCAERLEEFLDGENLYFRYDPNKNNFSVIAAEFVVQGEINCSNGFLFVDRRKNGLGCFCRSFFSRDDVKYTQKLPRYTLLRKEKYNTKTGKSIVQYDRLLPSVKDETCAIQVR